MVPPKVTLPETASRSDWPAAVPPTSMARVPSVRLTLPMMFRVPAAPLPPGLMVPRLVRTLPAPTSTLPVPEIVPALVKPPERAKVELLARLRVPAWLKEPSRSSVPLWTFTKPALLRST